MLDHRRAKKTASERPFYEPPDHSAYKLLPGYQLTFEINPLSQALQNGLRLMIGDLTGSRCLVSAAAHGQHELTNIGRG